MLEKGYNMLYNYRNYIFACLMTKDGEQKCVL